LTRERLPNLVLNRESAGMRRKGKPGRRWINSVEEDLKKINFLVQ
jgi:hypothetical protein